MESKAHERMSFITLSMSFSGVTNWLIILHILPLSRSLSFGASFWLKRIWYIRFNWICELLSYRKSPDPIQLLTFSSIILKYDRWIKCCPQIPWIIASLFHWWTERITVLATLMQCAELITKSHIQHAKSKRNKKKTENRKKKKYCSAKRK